MPNISKLALMTSALALSGAAASAATMVQVTQPTSETVADGGVYSVTLGTGDRLDATVFTVLGDTDAALGIMFSPLPVSAMLSIGINTLETELFGTVSAYLSQDSILGNGDDVGGMLDSFGTFQFADISASFSESPFYVLLDWANSADDSFSFNVKVSAVPVPAAGLMLLAGLGGLAAARRRKG